MPNNLNHAIKSKEIALHPQSISIGIWKEKLPPSNLKDLVDLALSSLIWVWLNPKSKSIMVTGIMKLSFSQNKLS